MATPLSPSGRIGESGSSTRLEDRSGPDGGDPNGSYDSDEFTSGSDSSSSGSSSSSSSEDDDYYDSEANLSQNLSTRFQSKKGYDSRMSMDSFVDEEEYTEEGNEGDSKHYSRRDSSLNANVGVFEQMGMETTARDAGEPLPKHSAFPSNKLLLFLVLCILLGLGAFVGCIVYFYFVPPQLAPEEASQTGGTSDGRGGPPTPPPPPPISIPTDEELIDIFQSLNLGNVTDTSRDAGRAAQWILNEDPGKTDPALLPRSRQGWIQRFYLAYFYFSFTEVIDGNRTEWVSCNPPAEGENYLCEFSSPVYLPNGDIIYDSIPASRWLSGADECLWGGIGCGATVYQNSTLGNGQIYQSAVTSIELGGQNLTGNLVSNNFLLDFPTVLPELEVVDLSNNQVEGFLSTRIWELTRCNLSNNKISSYIPYFERVYTTSMEDSPLVELDVSSNLLTGSIPEDIQLSTALKSLSVADNNMTGTIPFFGDLPLETFYGQNNEFTGIIPFDFGYDGLWPSTLKEFIVSNNKLTGLLPIGLGYVSNLEDLRVDNNMLVGTIPESIGTLDRLFRFDARDNLLTGTIPESVGSLDSLEDLRLQFNGLTGEVPEDLCLKETMVILEANCAFTDEEREQAAIIETNNDVIPVFGSLEEAIAAAQGQLVVTAPPTESDATPAPQPFEYSDVDCACCTTCCDPESGECLKFSTNQISVTALSVNDILV